MRRHQPRRTFRRTPRVPADVQNVTKPEAAVTQWQQDRIAHLRQGPTLFWSVAAFPCHDLTLAMNLPSPPCFMRGRLVVFGGGLQPEGRPNLPTPSVGKNDAQPTSMMSENVHRPRHSPIPRCMTTEEASTSGRHNGIQTSAQKEISQSRREMRQKVDQPGVPGEPGDIG